MTIAAISIACSGKEEYKSVDFKEFKEVVATPNAQLVDVRTAEEYSSGHIPGATNIDVKSPDFDSQICSLDKSRPVAVYCRSGRRSKIAADRLVKAGFEVIEFDGGFLSWEGETEK